MTRVILTLALLAGTLSLLNAKRQVSLIVVAGNGQPGYQGDTGHATHASLNQPFHCAWRKEDGKPVLYVVEQLNHCLRRIDLTDGEITTVAGNRKPGYSGDGGKATEATMNDPHAIDFDGDGNLYVADRLNFVIRKVDLKKGIITTVAGNGKKGSSGDGGPATAAQLVEPDDCCYDGKGGLLIADVGDWRIRRVDLKTGIIGPFAGTGRAAGKIDRTKIGDGGPAAEAVIPGARAVCVDKQGNTYICEREGNAIRKITADGIISTIAGTGTKGYSGDGALATTATFNGPKAIRCDHRGNLLIADTENHAIRRIDLQTKVITTIAGGKGELKRPHGAITDPDGNLYVADSDHHRVWLLRK